VLAFAFLHKNSLYFSNVLYWGKHTFNFGSFLNKGDYVAFYLVCNLELSPIDAVGGDVVRLPHLDTAIETMYVIALKQVSYFLLKC
jgi:hypothetical protein